MDLLRNLVALRNDSGFDLSLPDPQQADQGSRDVGRGEGRIRGTLRQSASAPVCVMSGWLDRIVGERKFRQARLSLGSVIPDWSSANLQCGHSK
jgi:hypothetical protein